MPATSEAIQAFQTSRRPREQPNCLATGLFYKAFAMPSQADSSLKCNDGMTRVYLFHKDLVRRFEAEAFSGTVVEPMRGEFDVIRGDGFEPHLLRKELTDEAVHILVGTALP